MCKNMLLRLGIESCGSKTDPQLTVPRDIYERLTSTKVPSEETLNMIAEDKELLDLVDVSDIQEEAGNKRKKKKKTKSQKQIDALRKNLESSQQTFIDYMCLREDMKLAHDRIESLEKKIYFQDVEIKRQAEHIRYQGDLKDSVLKEVKTITNLFANVTMTPDSVRKKTK